MVSPLCDPLNPLLFKPSSLPYVRAHLNMCLKHRTTSPYALFPLSIYFRAPYHPFHRGGRLYTLLIRDSDNEPRSQLL